MAPAIRKLATALGLIAVVMLFAANVSYLLVAEGEAAANYIYENHNHLLWDESAWKVAGREASASVSAAAGDGGGGDQRHGEAENTPQWRRWQERLKGDDDDGASSPAVSGRGSSGAGDHHHHHERRAIKTSGREERHHHRDRRYKPHRFDRHLVTAADRIHADLQHSSPIVIEKYKLLFVHVPKNACTVWKLLFYRMLGHEFPPQPDAAQWNALHNARKNKLKYLSDYPVAFANMVMQDPAWTRAIFVRNPHERLLSAFLDKGHGHNFKVLKD